MSIHKFNSELARASTEALAVGLHFQHEIYGFAETVLKARAIRALEGVAVRYPIYRSVRCAARRKVEEIFDDLALHSGLGASRLDAMSLLLDGPGVFIEAEGRRKAEYSSCAFAVWTDSISRAAVARLFREDLPAIEVIKWRDLYNDLENAIDAAEDAAEAIERMYHKAN